LVFALSVAAGSRVFAQPITPQQNQLRERIERRFDVLPLRSGIALRPKDATRGFRSIEIAEGSIAIDGQPATESELRSRLGDDADVVLPLWYLDEPTRQRLFETVSIAPRAPEAPEAPKAPVAPEPPAPPVPFGERRESHEGDQVRFGGSVMVTEGERVAGDVVAIGGSVTVNGEVTGDAVAIGGSLDLGPHAWVHGDAVTVGGTLHRDPGARVSGKVVQVGPGSFDLGTRRFRNFPFGRSFSFPPLFGPAAGVVALIATLARLVVLSVLASIVLLIGHEYVQKVGDLAAAEPLKAGAIGLLAELLFLPLLVAAVLILIVTIVGIPLAILLIPTALVALVVIGLVGFTGVAYNVGRFVRERLQWTGHSPYKTAITGIVVLLSPLLVARLLGFASWIMFPVTGGLVVVGILLEYLAWTIGFGAVALHRFARPAVAAPPLPPATPPLPPAAPSATSL
jgi:hypothetical protein